MKATDSGIKEASAAAAVKGQTTGLRVKVAELRGWKLLGWDGIGRWEKDGERTIQYPPDYPNDLNACHEFEETLKDDCDLWMKYMALLVGKPWHFAWEADEVWGAVNASAEQRCRAFVKTMEATE